MFVLQALLQWLKNFTLKDVLVKLQILCCSHDWFSLYNIIQQELQEISYESFIWIPELKELPNEIFTKIFEFLFQIDKVHCELVCKKWYNILQLSWEQQATRIYFKWSWPRSSMCFKIIK